MAGKGLYRSLFLRLSTAFLSEEANQTDVEFCLQCTVNRYRDQIHKEESAAVNHGAFCRNVAAPDCSMVQTSITRGRIDNELEHITFAAHERIVLFCGSGAVSQEAYVHRRRCHFDPF